MSKYKNLKDDDLLRLLIDNEACKEFLFQMRWKGKPWCPECGYTQIMSKATAKDKYKFKCSNKRCNAHFTLTSRTVFEKSRSDLKDWFKIIYHCTDRCGCTSLKLSEKAEVAYGTALAMHHRLLMLFGCIEKVKRPTEGVWEVDQKFHGPDLSKASKSQRAKHPNIAGTGHCIPIQFAFKRSRTCPKIVCSVTPRFTKAKQDMDIAKTIIAKGSTVNTDAAKLYHGYKKYFKQHNVLNQSAGVHSDGNGAHLGNVNKECSAYEAFKKIYVCISDEYLALYLNEFMFHRDNRDLSHVNRFLLVFKHISQTFTKEDLEEIGRQNREWIRENVKFFDNVCLDVEI